MVEIIGQDNTQLKQVTCKSESYGYRIGCGAILRYGHKDLQKTGNREGYYYIRCPQCSQEVHIRSFG